MICLLTTYAGRKGEGRGGGGLALIVRETIKFQDIMVHSGPVCQYNLPKNPAIDNSPR